MNSTNRIEIKAEPIRPRPRPFGTDQKPRVVKVDLTTNKSQPPAAILVKYVDPSMSDLNSMKTSMYVPITTNDNSKSAPRLVMGAKPLPVFGQRHRPIVPIKPRHNLELNNIVDFGKQFTSTTIIVGGATRGEATIIHGPLTHYERYIKANTSLEFDGVHNANVIVQSNEIVLDTLQETSHSLGSEDNEVQTVHMIGDFPNIKKNSVNPAIRETFISTKSSPGTCFVSVHGPNSRNKDRVNSSKPWKIVGNGRSRMIADSQTSIPVSAFKAQLNDTTDIVVPLSIAPPIKNIIHLLHRGSRVSSKGKVGVLDLFQNPGRHLGSKILRNFTRHLNTRQILPEETFPDMELLPLGYTPKIDLTKVKRITRKRFYPEAEEYRRNLILAKESVPLRFEHFVTENETIETEFLHEEEILPDSDERDPIYVDESLNSLKREDSEGMMYLCSDDVTIESESILEENEDAFLDGSTIIMLQEDQKTLAKTLQPKSIEVLLAAAEKQGIDRSNIQKVIFCQTGNTEKGRSQIT